MANLDSFCAHRPQRRAGRDEETDFEIKSRNRRRKKMRGPGKFLDKESPIQGPWCRFRREARPASDIDTVVVDSLKALDPEWPIREAGHHRRQHGNPRPQTGRLWFP